MARGLSPKLVWNRFAANLFIINNLLFFKPKIVWTVLFSLDRLITFVIKFQYGSNHENKSHHHCIVAHG